MAVQREERRLAAILSADVVGYSRLMGADESGTLARLKTHRGEIIDPKIAEHHGRIAKLMGDGVLVEFASVVDAVQCATDIQRAMADRNADVAEERRIELRIGINVGDIIVDGDDIYGDGVNVAARLEGLAEPGGVCISRSTRDQVRDKLDLALKDMGEVEVKNIARPVRVFRIHIAEQGLAPPPDSPRTSAGRARTSDQQSIAVLPFENMSGDPEQEYFADGIAEDIITALSKVSGMFVIARNSSFTYKGQAVPVQKVSNALGVRHILEGSVRKAGNRVRITAQLVDGTSGGHLWAERYDRDLKDIFAVQDDVNQQIVSALEVELKAGEDKRLVSTKPMTWSVTTFCCAAASCPDAQVRRIEQASQYVPLERLALSPQCGFATSIVGNRLSINDQRRKLEVMCETARKVWVRARRRRSFGATR